MTRQIDAAQALDVIAEAWTAWASHRIEATELAGRVADALEAAGVELVQRVDADERHQHPD